MAFQDSVLALLLAIAIIESMRFGIVVYRALKADWKRRKKDD